MTNDMSCGGGGGGQKEMTEEVRVSAQGVFHLAGASARDLGYLWSLCVCVARKEGPRCAEPFGLPSSNESIRSLSLIHLCYFLLMNQYGNYL